MKSLTGSEMPDGIGCCCFTSTTLDLSSDKVTSWLNLGISLSQVFTAFVLILYTDAVPIKDLNSSSHTVQIKIPSLIILVSVLNLRLDLFECKDKLVFRPWHSTFKLL